MRRSVGVALTFLAVLSVEAAAQQPPPSELIVGTWEFQQASVGTRAGGTATWIFEADGAAIFMSGLYSDLVIRGEYRLDASRSPVWIDIQRDRGGTIYGIIEFLGAHHVRFAFKDGGPRPTSFGPYSVRMRRVGD
jgi:uncharacterized protein (TIGR03067 family)